MFPADKPSGPRPRRRAVLALVLVAGLGAGLWWWTRDAVSAPSPAPTLAALPGEGGLFGLTKVHRVQLTMTDPEWTVLEEDTFVQRGRGGGAPLSVEEGEVENDYTRESDGRLIHRGGGFGGIFPWVHAALESGGETFGDVGLRYKGNASYLAAQNQMRRNLKVKTDLFGKAPGLHGEKTLNFNAGALDPTRIRESLSYAVFRAAGVPAPRTAFAEVTLTVPGLFRRELLGLYTLVEQVNKSFAEEFLPGRTGLLLKPEGLTGGFTYYGEDWASYIRYYRPEREATPAEAARVVGLARLVAQAGDASFRREIGAYLDVENFLRYLAVNALLVNFDSFLNGRHNFMLYLDPDSNRIMFLPWDQDLSLGSFGGGRGGNPGSILDLSLARPYSGENRLIGRVLEMPEHHDRYFAIIRELLAGPFSETELLRTIGAIEQATAAALGREADAMRRRGEGANGTTGFGRGGGGIGRGPAPREFVAQRLRFVQRQLDGDSDGYVPSGGFGGGGGRGRGF
jgi:spore coat protein H